MRRLKDMTVHEISLVKRAANKRKFLITKTAEVSMPAPDLEKIRDSLLSVPEPILKAVDAVTKGTFAKDDGSMTLTDDQAARLKAAGRMLQPVIQDVPMDAIAQMLSAIGAMGTDALMDTALADGVDADDANAAAAVDDATDAADAAAQDAASASEAADAAEDAMDDASAADPVVATPEEDPKALAMQRALAKSKEVYAQMLKDAGYDPDEEEGEAVPAQGAQTMTKTADTEKQAVAKSLRDAHDELAKKHKEAVSKSISLQLQLDKQEVIAKAAELPHLGKSDEIVDMLLRAKQQDAKGFDEHFKVMKTWNDTIAKSGMFTEHGSVATDEGAGIEARIDRAVANIVAKTGDMTTEKAYTHFITNTPEGREMFREYMSGPSNSAKG